MRASSYTSLLVAAAVGFICGTTLAADPTFIYVEVQSGGKVCTVQKRETRCDAVVKLVQDALHSSPKMGVTVSPKACGEGAMAEAQVVAEQLKKAGVKGVYTIGFLTDPSGKCAS